MDPQLPQMETVLDPQAMLGILASDWLAASRRYQLRDCRIGSVRHKPGKSCLIRYDLSLRDLDLGVDVHQVLCGRLHEEGGSDSRWRKAIAQPSVNVAFGPAVAHLPRLDLVLWAFPNERKLCGIEALFDSQLLREEVLPSILGEPVILDVDPELVRYVPEHGCTVRVRLTLPTGKLVLYGKIQAGADGAKICALARGLGRRAWHHAGTKTLWQQEIPGASAQLQTDLDACAGALAMFHQQQLPGLSTASDAPVGKRFEAAVKLLSGHKAPLQAIIAEVERRWSPSPAAATLHGDLHLKNFLVQAGTAVLIDLDTLSSGNPLEDLGSFAASLYHRAVLDGMPIAQVDELVARFVRTYASLVPWTIAGRDVATHTAAALVNERACRSITRRKGNVVDQLFAIAQNLLTETATARDVMERFAASASSHSGELIDVYYKTYRKQKSWAKSSVTIAWRDNSGIVVDRLGPSPASWRFPHDPAVPWMAEAADPGAVLAHLPVRADHVEIDVLTYRPENRLTARYRIMSDGRRQTVYGKTYSDDRGLQVHNRFIQLIERGFPMPQPLGYSPAIKTVWQASFEGEPLRALLHGPQAVQLLQCAARRLRILHESKNFLPGPLHS